jgi:hypothetical protein
MATIATVGDVEKYLPNNLPTDITSSVIADALEGAHGYYVSRIRPKVPSATSELDVLIEVLLAAVEVRDQITGLSSAEGSRTKGFEDRAEKMIEAQIEDVSGGDDTDPLPVGPSGRGDVGKSHFPIFDVPRPDSDDYDDLDADDPHRPELIGS